MALATSPRIGLIARADNTGLGVQTHDLYRFLMPHKTYVIDLTELNALNGKQTAIFPDRYSNAVFINGFPTEEQMEAMLDDIDVLFTVEIPYGYELFAKARARGVKTILQYNYEFLDYLNNPDLPLPDLFLAPTSWHFNDVKSFTESKFARLRYLPVPVDRHALPYYPRLKAYNFVHVAGHKTYEDRNGTNIVMESLKYITSDIKVTIHCQNTDMADELANNYDVPDNVHLMIFGTEVKEHTDIYNNHNYDVLLLPRRYGGLTLQMQEAMSVGMPVIMPDVPPNNVILPPASLVTVKKTPRTIHTRTEIECYDLEPQDLAAKIDELANDKVLVTNLSMYSDKYSKDISWVNMQPKYLQLINELVQG